MRKGRFQSKNAGSVVCNTSPSENGETFLTCQSPSQNNFRSKTPEQVVSYRRELRASKPIHQKNSSQPKTRSIVRTPNNRRNVVKASVPIITKLTSDDPGTSFNSFGSNSFISGNTIVVSASQSNFNGTLSGTVDVFEKQENAWVQTAKLFPSDSYSGQVFGAPIAIDGKTIVASAIGDSVNEFIRAGSIYIFEQIDGVWVETTKIENPDPEIFEQFGSRLAIHGKTIVVGTYFDNQVAPLAGAVYIFEQIGGEWVYKAKLTSPNPVQNERFGFAVSIYGKTLLVSSFAPNGFGKVYVFEEFQGQWTYTQELVSTEPQVRSGYGFSTTIYKDVAVVGSFIDGSNQAGRVFIFERFKDGWTQVKKIDSPTNNYNDYFGVRLAIDGKNIVVSALRSDGQQNDQGAAYIYSYANGDWMEIKKIDPPDIQVASGFATSVSIDNKTIVIGTPGVWNQDNSRGAVYVFEDLV